MRLDTKKILMRHSGEATRYGADRHRKVKLPRPLSGSADTFGDCAESWDTKPIADRENLGIGCAIRAVKFAHHQLDRIDNRYPKTTSVVAIQFEGVAQSYEFRR